MTLRRRQSPRVVLPSPGTLRRERRSLLAARDERLRDLGGLLVEMFRQDRFNEELIRERCSELLDLDRQLEELEQVLQAATHRAPLRRCMCGSELPPFSRFCPGCGRPADQASQDTE